MVRDMDQSDHLVVRFDLYQLKISCIFLRPVVYVGLKVVELIFLLLLSEGTVSHILKSYK